LNEGPIIKIDIDAAPDQKEKNIEFDWESSIPEDV
jgi:hypothetical protein